MEIHWTHYANNEDGSTIMALATHLLKVDTSICTRSIKLEIGHAYHINLYMGVANL
ncbi:hypothetical protein AG1IA_10398 [Rhizoctonia solani AG-1 IA]|uniref:Uncharacterized protein n=1 Tax=Thanatephorus cucumeris (strain AG1-IA) TaxID=983506 RepID=L8WFS6_THACA|nr:hypothetical protein AG1IA_10398 [Rhizoctonia solani AG-1 IA]